MPRPARSRLSPWIERLILSYGSQEEEGASQLKAHVVGVGQMSLSQAASSEGPTGLLFLSDGALQIPAVLTASAWEHLQEQEDRECFSSLLNSTVCIQAYRLHFHMAPEQTKCRFFLSVGELATTAAGPVKDNTPCCTTMPSVRMKICRMWRTLLGQEDSQRSQCGFDLSDLLGEWQHDCLRTVLEDVRERLKMASGRPTSQRPSTSTSGSMLTCPATSWDADRVKYKGEKCFSVPVKCLLIPEEDTEQVQTPTDAESRTERMKTSETVQPSVDDAQWQISQPAAVEGVCAASEHSPLSVEDAMLCEDMITDETDRPLSNPWDMFPPPCVSFSSSDASSEATPNTSLQSKPDPTTSTYLPVSLVESSSFPPFQKQPTALTAASSSASTSPPGAEGRHTLTAQQSLPALDQESEEMVVRRYRNAKRKRSEPTPEALTTLPKENEEQLGDSPPSWLFDSQAGASKDEESSSPDQDTATNPRHIPNVHRDGKPFSYSYQVCGQNLQDFSRFRVSESLLHWAVKYLVSPKDTDSPTNVA